MFKTTIKTRALLFNDLEKRVELFNKDEVFNNMSFCNKLEVDKTLKWYMNNLGNSNRLDLVFCKDKKIVGMGGLTHIDKKNCNGELYIAIFPEFQGMGYGKAGVYSICDWGFNKINLNRIYLFTYASNGKAIKMYEKMGFIYEGEMRQHIYDGNNFSNRAIYGLLKKEWH